MSQEAKKGLVRIITNYARLFSNLVLGVAVVPLLLHWLGDEAFGLISILGANIGIAGIFRQIIQMSLTRELGSAYHAGDEQFRANFAMVCRVALMCAGLTLVTFAILYAAIPLFTIPEGFDSAARWFVLGQGLFTLALVITAPVCNMYLVVERFVGYNLMYIAIRASNISSVLILGYVVVIEDPALGFALHGIVWACLAIIAMVVAGAIIIRSDGRFMFTLKGASKESRKQVLSTFGWNTGVQVAMNIHEQIPQLFLNFYIGPLANAAWGVGFRLVAYIRMCTTGIQFGSDAVSARLASGESEHESRIKLQRLINIQTKLTAMIALPAGLVVFFYARPIFELWIGSTVKNYDAVLPVAVLMARILAFALIARAVSDTWLLVLYGAGFVKRYAPLVMAGGVIAPLGTVLIMELGPAQWRPYAPAVMFSGVLVTLHFFGLPLITARCLHLSWFGLLWSLRAPLASASAAIGSAVLVLVLTDQFDSLGFSGPITRETSELIEPVPVLVSLAVFGLVYAALAWGLVLDTAERQRILSIARRLRP